MESFDLVFAYVGLVVMGIVAIVTLVFAVLPTLSGGALERTPEGELEPHVRVLDLDEGSKGDR